MRIKDGENSTTAAVAITATRTQTDTSERACWCVRGIPVERIPGARRSGVGHRRRSEPTSADHRFSDPGRQDRVFLRRHRRRFFLSPSVFGCRERDFRRRAWLHKPKTGEIFSWKSRVHVCIVHCDRNNNNNNVIKIIIIVINYIAIRYYIL